ncbi:hypothetical protein Osc1_06040 [Hominimerdicola sp. 21CYCFAH17_S]
MSQEELKKMRELDKAAEKYGGFTAPLSDKTVRYDYRKISRYCKEKGIEPVDMTIRELNRFIIKN